MPMKADMNASINANTTPNATANASGPSTTTEALGTGETRPPRRGNEIDDQGGKRHAQ
jgi:hypothetical protein